MIDSDLLEELELASTRIGGIAKLQPDDASAYVAKIANIYVADRTRLRWWESLKVPVKHLNYGDADGLSEVARLIADQGNAMLVVTDDEAPPWPVYSGNVSAIIDVLRECRFFEYILAAQDLRWIVFDTHINELVSAGQFSA